MHALCTGVSGKRDFLPVTLRCSGALMHRSARGSAVQSKDSIDIFCAIALVVQRRLQGYRILLSVGEHR
jgi:hypothetical protein